MSINKRFSIDVPEFTNKSTILIDKINFKEQINGVDFSRKDFPSMLVNLEEAVLDNAFINIDAVFDGLGDSAFDIDMTLTLPDFFTLRTTQQRAKQAGCIRIILSYDCRG